MSEKNPKLIGITDKRNQPGGPSSKNNSIANKQRYLHRAQGDFWKGARELLQGKKDLLDPSIEKQDISKGPTKNTEEPTFRHGPGGRRETVHPGNQDYIKGDKIQRPKAGSGGGGGGGEGGEGERDVREYLPFQKFLDFLFDGLDFPFLRRDSQSAMESGKRQRAGFVNEDNPSRRVTDRTLRKSMGRRIGMGGRPKQAVYEAWRDYVIDLTAYYKPDSAPEKPQFKPIAPEQGFEDGINSPAELLKKAVDKLAPIVARRAAVPFIDPKDIMSYITQPVPKPYAEVVMIFVKDASGSMNETKVELTKLWSYLWYKFVERKHKGSDIKAIFIDHDSKAVIVDQEKFWNKGTGGSTVISSALELIEKLLDGKEIAKDTKGNPIVIMPTTNVYLVQSSDGDNDSDDNPKCEEFLPKLLKRLNYIAYLNVPDADDFKKDNASDSRFIRRLQRMAQKFPNLSAKVCPNNDANALPGLFRESLTPPKDKAAAFSPAAMAALASQMPQP